MDGNGYSTKEFGCSLDMNFQVNVYTMDGN